MAETIGKQKNIAVNTARQMIFIEGENLCFNYKTGQWTEIPAYDGLAFFSTKRKDAIIGTIRYAANGTIDQSVQLTTGEAQTAVIETASQDISEGGRAVIRGVRPLHKGGEAQVKIGIQDDLSEAVQYTSNIDVNSRTGMADMRVEGRYMRVRVTFNDLDATSTIYGADVDFMPQGRV